MAQTDIHAVIVAELAALTDSAVTVTAQTNIVRELNLGSLAVMDLVMALEDHFDISIPLDRIADIETVDELADLVRSLQTGIDA